jgi:hypothetical protein
MFGAMCLPGAPCRAGVGLRWAGRAREGGRPGRAGLAALVERILAAGAAAPAADADAVSAMELQVGVVPPCRPPG